MLKKIFEEPMAYILWEVDGGYIFSAYSYQGVAGDRSYAILLSVEEGHSLIADPRLRDLKYAAIATNPELFRDDIVDPEKYK